MTKITDDKIKYYNPVWSRDSKRLVFYSVEAIAKTRCR